MQPKISSFFKSAAAAASSLVAETDIDVQFHTYKRRALNSDRLQSEFAVPIIEKEENPVSAHHSSSLKAPKSRKTVNKNKDRSYVQLHLELGQSDFHLHTCSTCGLRYTPGSEEDEDFHKTFHKNYTNGIQCKGWRNERVVSGPSIEGGRIILVTESDSAAQRKKVQDVIEMMETELGCGWIYHKLCKVYLFISSNRITGCLVAEPIKEAFKVIPGGIRRQTIPCTSKERKSIPATLHFGEVTFQREVMKKNPPDIKLSELDKNQNGALLCETDAVPAVSGIRAIWVTQSSRRIHVATRLLNTLRESFCPDRVLEKSELAFSDPTSSGKALAFNYFGTESFLVYKAENPNC